MHMLVCYLNELQNARCNDKNNYSFSLKIACYKTFMKGHFCLNACREKAK